MQGFIYLWRDRKHNRFYVGCHCGDENDGYVCSSTWMLQAYKKRPQDFKRRILERFEDRSKANEIEHRWLQMIKTNELKGKRYYNFHNYRFGHWSSDERSRMTVGQKISDAKKNPSMETRAKMSKSATGKKRTFTEEHKRNISIAQKGVTRKGSPKSEATKLKMSLAQKGRRRSPWTNERKEKASERLKLQWADETRKRTNPKIAASKMGRPRSEETKKKISDALKGRSFGHKWTSHTAKEARANT